MFILIVFAILGCILAIFCITCLIKAHAELANSVIDASNTIMQQQLRYDQRKKQLFDVLTK